MTWPIKTPAEIQREIAEAQASWRNLTAGEVRAKLRAMDGHPFRMLVGKLLATALRRHAPHHLGLLPPEFLDGDTRPRLAAE